MARVLKGKCIISGKIRTMSGFHIGGSKSALDIGGVNMNVIKSRDGIPFIPGSSLKGKLRSLLALEEGAMEIKDESPELLCIFGSPGDEPDKGQPSRLIVRDAYMTSDSIQELRDLKLDLEYTVAKTENVIDRKKGTAEHPRQVERVPEGVEFCFQMIYNVVVDKSEDAEVSVDGNEQTKVSKSGTPEDHLLKIQKAMRLLEDDYLGGQGSRGYGRVEFKDVSIEYRPLSYYEVHHPTPQKNGETREFDNFLEYGEDQFRALLSVGSREV